MLACTRIGAAHSVHLRRLLARLDHRPRQRRRGQGDHHGRRRLPAGRAGRRSSRTSTRRSARRHRSAVVVVQRDRCESPDGTDVTMVDGRDHWYHELMAAASPDCPPEHMDSEDLLYLLYTSGTTAKPKGIMHTTGGYLTQVAFTPQVRVRPQARDRRVLVRGRHRLGHGPQLHRLRAAGQRGHLASSTRARPTPPAKDRLWEIVETLRGDAAATPRPPPSGRS